METTLVSFYCQTPHQYSPRLSTPSSPPETTNIRRCHNQNVQVRANFTMPLTDFTIRRITTTQYQFRFNHHRPISINSNLISVSPKPMADESKKIDTQTTTMNLSKSEEVKEKEPEKSTTAVPPPPEKPLPGDCCGSGCFRCVWDVYYEELEDYNKLYKANS